MEQIKDLMKSIINCVSAQTANMENADTKELSEAMDMIKDLAMAEYYCVLTKAMENPENVYGENWDENGPMKKGYSYSRRMMPRGYDEYDPMRPMYYTDDMMPRMNNMGYSDMNTSGSRSGNTSASGSSMRGYSDSRYDMARRGYKSEGNSQSLNKIFDVIEQDMKELKPTMTPQDVQTAKTRLGNLSNMM